MADTIQEFKEIITECRTLFEKKTADYGTAWRILRLPTFTDQIFIKAKRIQTIQDLKEQKVEDSIRDEFIGIINYCLIALIQSSYIELKYESYDVDQNDLFQLYDQKVDSILQLLENKNHDYGEAWKDMRVTSMTDLILQKLLRIKRIEDNNGQTLISEGVKSSYKDIVNYAVFCLIKIKLL